jgi:RimJ/RimL family protein N-acetyltransferase
MRPDPGVEQAEIRSARLLLRPFEPADAEAVRKLADDFAVSRSTLNIPYPYPRGAAERWIASHRRNWELRTSASYAITLAGPDLLLGAVTLTSIHRRLAELGYWTGSAHWNRGYCSEAVGAIIDFAFERLGITKIVAEHLRGNPASGRVMQKVGMRYVGSRRKPDRGGNPAAMEIYEISKSSPAASNG